jgi:hypothetical protein
MTTIFFRPSLLLLFLVRDPGSKIRDPEWVKIRIQDKHPGSATLPGTGTFVVLLWDGSSGYFRPAWNWNICVTLQFWEGSSAYPRQGTGTLVVLFWDGSSAYPRPGTEHCDPIVVLIF